MRPSLIFTITLFIIFVILLIATLNYPPRAMYFPLITIFVALILLGSRILPREILASRQKKEVVKATEAEELKRKYLSIGWLTLALAMLWILGFLGMVVLLPFLYLRHRGESWLLSVNLPLGCGIFFYTFALFLKMPLYKGLFFSAIFG